jgi:predicted nucleotidyltransferase
MPAIVPELSDIQQTVQPLCKSYHVARMDLVGSAACGDYKPGESDLNFLVTLEPCTPVQHTDRYFGLLFALEDTFGNRIDLIEETALSNPVLIRSFQATRVLLYAENI